MQLNRTALRYLALAVGSLLLLAAIGCGTGGSSTIINPQGNFSNASLNGSYVYELHGEGQGSLGNFVPYREVGVLTADGQGNIGKSTPGSDDISGSSSPVAVTGTYTIAKDGTGTITMTSQLGTINLAVTMVSNSKVYLMEADGLATSGLGVNAVGVADLQDPSAINSTPAGPFAFRIHEEIDLNGRSESQVGGFNTSTSGTNGSMDQNDGGAFTSPNIAWTFNSPAALGRGTGTYVNGSSGITNNFIYYVVSSSKVDVLVSDLNVVGSGEAEAQTGAVGKGLSGSYAFGSSGDDSNCQGGLCGTFAAVGAFNASSGNISGLEDVNVDGNISSSAGIAACYTPNSNGRVVVVSSSGSSCSTTTVQVFWMVNPSRAFFLDVNPTIFDDGSADLQTVTSFSQSTLSGQFALLMGGVDASQVQFGAPIQLLTRVGTLQFNSGGALVLNELANGSNAGGPSPSALSGTFTTSPNGRITGGAGNSNGGVDFVMYAVSGSEAYVMQNDTNIITAGTLELQP